MIFCLRFRCALIVLFLFAPSFVKANEYNVPISIQHEIIAKKITTEVYRNNGKAWIWGQQGDCNFLVLSDPVFRFDQANIIIDSQTDFLIGTAYGNQCRVIFEWQGTTRTIGAFSAGANQQSIELSIKQSTLLNTQREPIKWTKRIANHLQQRFYPKLDRTKFEFTEVLNNVDLFLQTAHDQKHGAFLDTKIESVTGNTESLQAILRIATSLSGDEYFSTYQPPLTDLELDKLVSTWNQWERFISHIIAEIAKQPTAEPYRQDLFDILIDSRYRIIEILSADFADGEYDPVQNLFIDVWQQLQPMLTKIYDYQEGSGSYYDFLSFVSASEAITVLSELGPRFGVDISQNGLRELARNLSNRAVEFEDAPEVDKGIRELFRFNPDEPLPPQIDNRVNLLNILFPTANAEIPAEDNLTGILLEQMVVNRNNLSTYLPIVLQVLERASHYVMSNNSLTLQQNEIYRALVPATAWKESCWRHWISKNNSIVALTSSAKAVGIMQVTPYVWRDFYDSDRLKNDMQYNIYAGSEILMHYMRDYAIRKGEHRQSGGIYNLAYATYATYNGGPSHLKRYRRDGTKKSLRIIDAKFKQNFLDVLENRVENILLCYGIRPSESDISLKLTQVQ